MQLVFTPICIKEDTNFLVQCRCFQPEDRAMIHKYNGHPICVERHSTILYSKTLLQPATQLEPPMKPEIFQKAARTYATGTRSKSYL